MKSSRRVFVQSVAAATALPFVDLKQAFFSSDKKLHLACNEYAWYTFYKREGRAWNENLDTGLNEFSAAGLDGLEPSISSVSQLQQLAVLLEKYDLEMRSLYVNSTLHQADEANASIDEILTIAENAYPLGVRIIVTNPTPLQWGGIESKTDAQLKVQAESLNRLGAELDRQGQTLAYHNHDAELRHAAREFHHMMQGTDPEKVKLCLDAHWIFRGSGDSQVALFDVIKLYGSRVREIHLRQSSAGVWTEQFGPGDINYERLAELVYQAGVRPHLVLEQSVEEQTPQTMDAVEAHRKGAAHARQVFAAFAE